MHLLPVNTESVYLDLTFITLAMLVVGGATSLWGAVVGALAVSALDSYLAVAENGTSLFGWHIDLPRNARDRRRRADGARPDPAPVRPDRRPRVPSLAEVDVNRVCIAGAGVIGSLFAAYLARVTEVTGADAPRGARARAERARPACQRRGDFTSRVTAATEPGALPEPDLVIVASKGGDVELLAAQLAGHWPEATLMTVQNGIGADEIVARHGDWPLLSAVTFMSGTRHDDTHVEYVLDTATWIGPYRGYDARRRARCRRADRLVRPEGRGVRRPACRRSGRS